MSRATTPKKTRYKLSVCGDGQLVLPAVFTSLSSCLAPEYSTTNVVSASDRALLPRPMAIPHPGSCGRFAGPPGRCPGPHCPPHCPRQSSQSSRRCAYWPDSCDVSSPSWPAKTSAAFDAGLYHLNPPRLRRRCKTQKIALWAHHSCSVGIII